MKSHIFTVEYVLHGEAKSFVVRDDKMDNAEAWHWASCDAGLGHIMRNSRDKTRKTSKPMAERFGISDVRWSASEGLAT